MPSVPPSGRVAGLHPPQEPLPPGLEWRPEAVEGTVEPLQKSKTWVAKTHHWRARYEQDPLEASGVGFAGAYILSNTYAYMVDHRWLWQDAKLLDPVPGVGWGDLGPATLLGLMAALAEWGPTPVKWACKVGGGGATGPQVGPPVHRAQRVGWLGSAAAVRAALARRVPVALGLRWPASWDQPAYWAGCPVGLHYGGTSYSRPQWVGLGSLRWAGPWRGHEVLVAVEASDQRLGAGAIKLWSHWPGWGPAWLPYEELDRVLAGGSEAWAVVEWEAVGDERPGRRRQFQHRARAA